MRRHCRPIGAVVVGLGIFIILALILPSVVWWFFIGIALIALGLIIIWR